MTFWNSLKEQLLTLWNRWTIVQRVGFSAAAFACVAAVTGTLIWASQPDYVVLLSGLSPKRGQEIAGILDTEKITYQLNFPGSAISVASSDVAKARYALKEEMSPEEVEQTEFDMLTPGSPQDAQQRRLRSLEKRIQRTILQIQGIRTATVNISEPDKSPFSDQFAPVTATVVVGPKPGVRMTNSVAHTILAMVAHAVPELTTGNITLADTNGIQFGSKDEIQSSLDGQLSFKERIEALLSNKAMSSLERMKGVRAIVTVDADIDFSQQKRTTRTVDPTSKVATSEFILKNNQSVGAPPTGIAGAAANIPADANSATNNNGGRITSDESKMAYDASATFEEVTNLPGTIKRLSISAIVEVLPPETSPDANAPAGAAALTLEREQFEELIGGTVGFNFERGDEITVVLAPIAPVAADEIVVPGFVWEQWQPLIQSVSLGLAASLAFLIGMMLMKRMKPIVITETVGPGIPLADARRLASLSEQAKANPDIVANILSVWLNEQETAKPEDVPATASTGTRTPAPVPPSSGTSVPRSAMPRNTGAGGEQKAA